MSAREGLPTLPRHIIVMILVGSTLACVLPLLAHTALPSAHDVAYHVLWARGFVAAIGEGILYPRWLSDPNFGFGAPTFVLYAPLGFYLIALAKLLTNDLLDMIRLAVVAGTLLSALSFYVSFRDVASDEGAAVGAALYVLLPYHVFDLYGRFAYAEYLAFIWYPPLFWGVRRLGRGFSWGAWFAVAGAYAGLMLTHIVSAYMVLHLLVPYAAVTAFRARRWTVLAHVASAGAAALLCSAVYWFPAIVERGETNYVALLQGRFDYRHNFLSVAGAIQGLLQFGTHAASSTLVSILLSGATVLFGRTNAEVRILGALAAWTFFLEISLSAPLWAALPELPMVGFPWRFAAFGVLFAAAGAAVALSGPKWRETGVAVGLVAVLAVALSALIANMNSYVFDAEAANWDMARHRIVTEHLPARLDLSAPLAGLSPRQPDAVLSGPGSVETLAWTSETRRVRVDAPEGGRVLLRTFALSGWETSVDGQPVPHHEDARFHAIEVDIAPGTHELEAVYGSTWDRRAGAMASAGGLALMLGLGVVALRRKPLAARPRESPAS